MPPDMKPAETGSSQESAPAAAPIKDSLSFVWYIAGGVILIGALAAGYFLIVPKIQSGSEKKVFHVGVLNALDYFAPTIDGFKAKMTELGYVEGKNITYDVQKGPAPVGNQSIVKKFVDDKVDLILVFPTEASLEAKEGTKGTNIPIVSTEPAIEGTNLVQSIQNPGGNLTAVRFPIVEVASKRLEILHEIVPKATRIWIPYLKDYPTVIPSMAAIRPLADSYHVTLIGEPFATPDELKAYLAAHDKNPGMDAILLIPEPLSIVPAFIDQIYPFADAHKIPMASAVILDSDSGPIFSLIPDAYTVGQLAAPLADKIFRGTPAGSIPVVTPESVFEINVKAAQRLGITLSEGLLSKADKVVH